MPAPDADKFCIHEMDYIWIEFKKHVKEKDGSLTQILRIRKSKGLKNRTGLSKFYNIKAVYNINREKEFYRAPIQYRNNEAEIKITAGKTSFFKVYVFVITETINYIAETSFYVFGSSKNPIHRDILRTELDFLPNLKIIYPEYNYWPQTGQEFKFLLGSDKVNFTVNDAKVIDKGNIETLKLSPDGKFSYIPPSDKLLDLQGISAFKGNILYFRMKSNNKITKLTYTLLLHRSRFANLRLKHGIALFVGTIIFFTFSVLIARKRSPVII